MSSLPLSNTPSTEHQESATTTNSRPPSPRNDITSRLLTELGDGEGSSYTSSTVTTVESILPVLQQLAGTVKALQDKVESMDNARDGQGHNTQKLNIPSLPPLPSVSLSSPPGQSQLPSSLPSVSLSSPPGQSQPTQDSFRAPHEGDIAKFKATITYDGISDLEPFLFALNQSIRKYRLILDENKLIALGDSLRREAMGWWSHQKFGTFIEAVSGLENQFKDLGRHGEYFKKLNKLTQTSTVREFLREAEKLNQYTQIPEDALLLTLKQGLSTALHAALILYHLTPTT